MAASLVALGLVPGAAIVMLVFGAATNVPGLVLILRFLGKRAAIIFPLSAGIIALVAGYLVDLWLQPNLANLAFATIMRIDALGGIGSGGGDILYDA